MVFIESQNVTGRDPWEYSTKLQRRTSPSLNVSYKEVLYTENKAAEENSTIIVSIHKQTLLSV